jgi:hypothetical protein
MWSSEKESVVDLNQRNVLPLTLLLSKKIMGNCVSIVKSNCIFTSRFFTL